MGCVGNWWIQVGANGILCGYWWIPIYFVGILMGFWWISAPLLWRGGFVFNIIRMHTRNWSCISHASVCLDMCVWVWTSVDKTWIIGTILCSSVVYMYAALFVCAFRMIYILIIMYMSTDIFVGVHLNGFFDNPIWWSLVHLHAYTFAFMPIFMCVHMVANSSSD